jgi:hypothetical protein
MASLEKPTNDLLPKEDHKEVTYIGGLQSGVVHPRRVYRADRLILGVRDNYFY